MDISNGNIPHAINGKIALPKAKNTPANKTTFDLYFELWNSAMYDIKIVYGPHPLQSKIILPSIFS